MKEKMIKFFKEDTILVISGILAVISCFFITPDKKYIDYVNFRVLAILFSLMLVVSALIRIGTFDYLTEKLLGRISGEKYAGKNGESKCRNIPRDDIFCIIFFALSPEFSVTFTVLHS